MQPWKHLQRRASALSMTVYLFILFFTASCAQLQYLDRAQDQFNQGAALENQLRFNPSMEMPASPSLYYLSAYSSVNKALQDKSTLSKDDLLANAYTVKALCEWKLKHYEEAAKTADMALGEYLGLERKGLRMPRDKALMQALPHLVAIDRAKSDLYGFYAPGNIPYAAARQHYEEHIFDPRPDANAKLEAALLQLDNIRLRLEGNEDFAVYLVLAQLAGLKTWSDGLDFIRQSISKDGSLSPSARQEAVEFLDTQQKTHLDSRKKAALDILSKLLPEDKASQITGYWRKII